MQCSGECCRLSTLRGEVSFQHEQQHHVTEDDPGVVERDSPMVFAGVTVVGDWRQ